MDKVLKLYILDKPQNTHAIKVIKCKGKLFCDNFDNEEIHPSAGVEEMYMWIRTHIVKLLVPILGERSKNISRHIHREVDRLFFTRLEVYE